MSRMTLRLGTALTVSALALAGCYTRVVERPGPTRVVYAQSAPPAEVEETVPVAPGPATQWVWHKGHYRWDGSQYVWEAGHWVARPVNVAGVWVPGHYDHTAEGYVWVEGHYQ